MAKTICFTCKKEVSEGMYSHYLKEHPKTLKNWPKNNIFKKGEKNAAE